MIVVIPSYKEPLWRVQRTVQSALACARVERVIVVDDGTPAPHPRVPQELADIRVRVLYQPRNMGVAAALNAAIEDIEGDPFVARLEVGDVFTKAKDGMIDWMNDERIAAAFSPHVNLVTGELFVVNEHWAKRIYIDNQFTGVSTVFRRSVWAAVRGYDISLRWSNDWDFAMKVQRAVGWSEYLTATVECGEFPGGHTDTAQRDPWLAKQRDEEIGRVRDRGLRITHPDVRRRHHWTRK